MNPRQVVRSDQASERELAHLAAPLLRPNAPRPPRPHRAGGQPVARDSLPRLPEFRTPITEDFAPRHASAARAYLYSAAATGGLVVLGLLVEDAVSGVEDLEGIGIGLAVTGVIFGPSAGNVSLGAVGDFQRALVVSVGIGSGLVLGSLGFVSILGCVANADGQCDAAGFLFVSAVAVAATGVAIGALMVLTSIPATAARARRYRQQHPRVAVAPGGREGRR